MHSEGPSVSTLAGYEALRLCHSNWYFLRIYAFSICFQLICFSTSSLSFLRIGTVFLLFFRFIRFLNFCMAALSSAHLHVFLLAPCVISAYARFYLAPSLPVYLFHVISTFYPNSMFPTYPHVFFTFPPFRRIRKFQ